MVDDAQGDDATIEGPASHTVLHIDDSDANIRLVERLFARLPDIEVISATHGMQGLDIARDRHPAVVLLDLHLPDMPGEQFLRTLKEDPRTARIPVVAVTGEVAGDRPDLLRQLGALDVLLKPYRVQELMAILDRAMV